MEGSRAAVPVEKMKQRSDVVCFTVVVCVCFVLFQREAIGTILNVTKTMSEEAGRPERKELQ